MKICDKNSLFSQNIQLVESGHFALSKKECCYQWEVYAIENRQYKDIKDNVKQAYWRSWKCCKLQSGGNQNSKTQIRNKSFYIVFIFEEWLWWRVQKDYEEYNFKILE